MEHIDQAVYNLLCLRCRGMGHVAKACSLDTWPGERSGEYSWLYSQPRKKWTDFEGPCSRSQSVICKRCQSLNLVDLLDQKPPWNSQQELVRAYEDGHSMICNLGKVGTVHFRTDCNICQSLFHITPNPSSNDQDLMLLPDWTICRLSKEDVRLDSEPKRKYATCISIVLRPTSMDLAVNFRATFGDALCLLDRDLGMGRTLGGRKITRQEVDFEVVKQWLSSCSRLHGTLCTPVFTDELRQIRLINVQNRKVVAHPAYYCNYITLSYVWGGAAQRTYELGDILETLPPTLEDTIWVAKQLAINYVWIDSICIDQSDDSHKKSQINRMCSIYSGSSLNLVALSGESVAAGLSKVSRMDTYKQISCCVNGKMLVGLMPTLGADIEMSIWNERAWTFQEASLSPRSLYFSDRQLYYECNGMHCSESLDIARSWGHKLSHSANTTSEPFDAWMMREVGRGAFRCSFENSSQRFLSYTNAVHRYAHRKLTLSTDILLAFDGILKRQRFSFPKGFFFGLPLEEFNWALVWYPLGSSRRRPDFPTWSWAGWMSIVHYDHHGRESTSKDTICLPVFLAICMKDDVQLKQIFTSDMSQQMDQNFHRAVQNDNMNMKKVSNTNNSSFSLDLSPCSINDHLLFVDAICFHFTLCYDNPMYGDHLDGPVTRFALPIGSQKIFIRIIGNDSIIKDRRAGEEETFIIIARHVENGRIVYHLVLIHFDKFACSASIATRRAALQLHAPFDDVTDLEKLKPRRRQIVLA